MEEIESTQFYADNPAEDVSSDTKQGPDSIPKNSKGNLVFYEVSSKAFGSYKVVIPFPNNNNEFVVFNILSSSYLNTYKDSSVLDKILSTFRFNE